MDLARTIFILSLLWQSPSAHAYFVGDRGICEMVLTMVQQHKYEATGATPYQMRVFHETQFTRDFHEKKKIRDLAFKMLTQAGASEEIFDSLNQHIPADIEAIVKVLALQPETERTVILSNLDHWNLFIEQLELPADPADAAFVNYNGQIIEKDTFEKVIKIQAELQQEGLTTEIILTSEQKTVLVLKKIERQINRPMKPRESIFNSAEFLEYFKLIEAQNGAIIFDPNMESFSVAYFARTPDFIQGRSWIIAFKPSLRNAKWDSFIHEWQHKIDFIDLEGKSKENINEKIENSRSTILGKSLFSVGKLLEQSLYSELSATDAQIKFYVQTQSFPPLNVLNTVLYRSSNQRKVAIARIFMDPKNPDHYKLFLKSRATTYGIMGGAIGAVVIYQYLYSLIIDEINKFRHKAHRPLHH